MLKIPTFSRATYDLIYLYKKYNYISIYQNIYLNIKKKIKVINLDDNIHFISRIHFFLNINYTLLHWYLIVNNVYTQLNAITTYKFRFKFNYYAFILPLRRSRDA